MSTDAIQGFHPSIQQRHLWWLQQASGRVFESRAVVAVRGALDPAELQRRLADSIARHEILRTTFERLPQMALPLQVIADDERPWHHQLLQAEGSASVDELVEGLLLQPAEEIDLARGPIFLSQLLAVSPGLHLLYLRLPSMLVDRAGLELLLAELAAAFRGAELDDEPVQYADIASWQQETLDDDDNEAERRRWIEPALAVAAPPSLPFECVSLPIAASTRSAEAISRYSLTVDGNRWAATATELGSEPRWLLLAAFTAVLGRLADRGEVAVAVAAEGRGFEELSGVPGPLVRYLPLQVSLGGNAVELASRLAAAFATAVEHEDYFAWEAVARDDGGSADLLVPSLGFSAEKLPAPYAAGAVSLELVGARHEHEAPVLELVQVERGTELGAELRYDPRRVAAADVERFGVWLETFLAGVFDEPSIGLDRLGLVSAEERQQLLTGQQGVVVEPAGADGLHGAFFDQAAVAPEALAVVAEEPSSVYQSRRLSYGELARLSSRLAHYLRLRGVGVDDRVALRVDRGIDRAVGLLAILEAGAAYVPIEPESPPDRVRVMLEASGARFLLSTAELGPIAEAMPAGQEIELILFGDELPRGESPVGGQDEVIARLPAPHPEQLAYLIFTSGSSGTPKGVQVPHRAIVNRLAWMQREMPLAPGDRLLQKTSFSFDASVWELFLPWWVGATVVLARPGGERDAGYLAHTLRAEEITILQGVPSLLRVLAEEPELARCGSLRWLVSGGEALPVALARRLKAVTKAGLRNLYGPTETAIDATSELCSEALDGEPDDGTVPIGRPIDNVRTYVVDRYDNLQPVGIAGELTVGGVAPARGYAGQPGLTAERFVPDPWAAPGGRRYRTGDRVVRRDDGRLDFGGRLDQQVKIRGFRIEPGEIEAALERHEAVRQAVVAALPGDSGEPQLVAYVSPQPAVDAENAELHTLPGGLEVFCVNPGEADMIYGEIFADASYSRHGIELHDGATILDVGANIGLFSLWAHQQCSAARIVAFEPMPPACDRLRRNMALFGLATEVVEAAVGAAAGRAEMTYYPRWTGMSGAYADAEEEAELSRAYLANQDPDKARQAEELIAERFTDSRNYDCRVVTLSQVLREHGLQQVDLLKIDVEKAEMDVLAGLAEEDWSKIRQLVLEAHEVDGRVERLRQMLVDHGFEVVVEDDGVLAGTGMVNVYARRPLAGGETEPPATPQELVNQRSLTVGALRAFLSRSLPEHMLPARFVRLDKLPLLPSGKVDRRALPDPDQLEGLTQRAYVAPSDETEQVLAEIWAELLGKERIGAQDNFFELGGDSILSLQVVARARERGLELRAPDIFSNQTLAALARVAGKAPAVVAEQGPVVGPVPLLPSQRWLLAQELEVPAHYNQSLLLELAAGGEVDLIRKSLSLLLHHHDALRGRFECVEGSWSQRLAEPGEAAVVDEFDLSQAAPAEQRSTIERVGRELQGGLDLANGPLLRAAWFGRRAEPPILLLVAHHLMVDGVSWRLLLEDLERVYRQYEAGQTPQLPAKTTSLQTWGEGLAELAAASPTLEYWRTALPARVAPMPIDYQDGRLENRVGAVEHLDQSLSASDTDCLVSGLPETHRAQLHEALLAALVDAYRDWSGEPGLLVDLEGHGRDTGDRQVDLSRTVGWFTSLYPLWLAPEAGRGALTAVKEGLRRVPEGGASFGLLKYLGPPAAAAELAALPTAELSFNYLGRFDQLLGGAGMFRFVDWSAGPSIHPRAPRPHLLELTAAITDGALQLRWDFSPAIHRRSSIERLAAGFRQALDKLLESCRQPDQAAAELAPTDFPQARVSSSDLDKVLARVGARRPS